MVGSQDPPIARRRCRGNRERFGEDGGVAGTHPEGMVSACDLCIVAFAAVLVAQAGVVDAPGAMEDMMPCAGRVDHGRTSSSQVEDRFCTRVVSPPENRPGQSVSHRVDLEARTEERGLNA